MEEVTYNVKSCARCGQDHDNLIFKKFKNPFIFKNVEIEYWALCPICHEPILLHIISQQVITISDEISKIYD